MLLLNASGCLDALAAPEVARRLDAFVTKTITPLPREGNAPPRIAASRTGLEPAAYAPKLIRSSERRNDAIASRTFLDPSFCAGVETALEAFERSRATGETQIHLVSPPGSGKTVLGLEGARRLGRRTLVVCPNTAIQGQWVRQWQDFARSTAPRADLRSKMAVNKPVRSRCPSRPGFPSVRLGR